MRPVTYFLCSLSLVAACFGGNGDPDPPDGGVVDDDDDDGSGDDGPSSPDAPRFLSFGTNVSAISEGESIMFTAVLTDPDGIDDLIGGSLTSDDGMVQYGAFATSGQEGSYTLSVSWDQFQQVEDIVFLTMGNRVLRAEFFDVDGNSVQRTVTVSFRCSNGAYACAGRCGAACAVETLERVSPAQACTAQGLTCPTNGEHRAYYGTQSQYTFMLISTCSEVPAPISDLQPYLGLRAVCLPTDP